MDFRSLENNLTSHDTSYHLVVDPDRTFKFQEPQKKSISPCSTDFETNIQMLSGIGISIINRSHEELVYIRLQGIQMHLQRHNGTYLFSGNVNVVQVSKKRYLFGMPFPNSVSKGVHPYHRWTNRGEGVWCWVGSLKFA